jgi:hypothetical protein
MVPMGRLNWSFVAIGNSVASGLRSAYIPTNTRAAPLVRKDDAHQGRVFHFLDNPSVKEGC